MIGNVPRRREGGEGVRRFENSTPGNPQLANRTEKMRGEGGGRVCLCLAAYRRVVLFARGYSANQLRVFNKGLAAELAEGSMHVNETSVALFLCIEQNCLHNLEQYLYSPDLAQDNMD